MTNWVLVSGAGSGIGRHIAEKMARRGFMPILLGRNQQALEETARSFGGSEHRLAVADIRKKDEVRDALKACGVDAIHAVICCAGVGGNNAYGEEDRWDEILETNLTGSYYLTNESLPYLIHDKDDGDYRHIVYISSILARLGVPGYSAYCASKAGLLGLMRSYASELAPKRILVNAICPGWVSTNMARDGLRSFAEATGKTYDQVYAEQMAAVPLGKMSDPREVAEFVFFLISRVQGSITGQTLDINNGALMA